MSNVNGLRSRKANPAITEFIPGTFLRCHSKNDTGGADVSVQVWQAVFEPSRTSRLVATCGGNKLCVINVATEQVELRYSCPKGLLYTLSWSTVGEKKSILATAGTNNTIIFIDLSTKTAYHHYNLFQKRNSKNFINSILFHPDQKILFCGLNSGHLYVLEFETNKGRVVNLTSQSVTDLECEIFGLAFCQKSDCLLIATSIGLKGWTNFQKHDGELVLFKLPDNPNELYRDQNENVVDSIEIIKGNWIATKVALHGVIYIFDLKETLSNINNDKCAVRPSHVLKWSDTDNYFMSCGVGVDGKVLACGDDKGSIWIYNLDDLPETSENNKMVIEAENILKWPKLNDIYLEKKKKLELDVYDIVIAKCAIHSTGNYMVAVTNNNFVCLYTSL